MDLLLKREQNRNWRGRVVFRLWAKSELPDEERALLDRYNLDQAILLSVDDTSKLKWAFAIGLALFLFIAVGATVDTGNMAGGLFYGTVFGVGAGSIFYTQMRETIYVRDLLYGRQFKCMSIAELARKEAWLEDACVVLRQTLETAKHWDGVETNPIPVLEKAEAKQVVIRYAGDL